MEQAEEKQVWNLELDCLVFYRVFVDVRPHNLLFDIYIYSFERLAR